jgi:chromatin structure-remodeling complex subunit RSC1/2
VNWTMADNDNQESPPPDLNPPPTPAAATHMGMDLSRRPSDISMTGTPTYHHATPVPASSQSPAHYAQFAPRPGLPPTPQAHLQHLPPHVAHPQAQIQVPAYQPHAYQQPYAPPPMAQAHHYQTPAQMPPVYDHRASHPGPAMTPARTAVPTPSSVAMPHAGHAGNQYNMPRVPEVYTLPLQVESAIPEDVREQFHRDDQGRLLFFSAPPLDRPHPGIAEQYAGLGHSVSHLANVKKFYQARVQKRKERDEQLAAKQAAKKPALAEEEATAKGLVDEAQQDLMQKTLLDFCNHMARGNAAIEASVAGWREVKRQALEEAAGKTSDEIRADNLRWFAEDCEKRGTMTADRKAKFLATFVDKRNANELE